MMRWRRTLLIPLGVLVVFGVIASALGLFAVTVVPTSGRVPRPLLAVVPSPGPLKPKCAPGIATLAAEGDLETMTECLPAGSFIWNPPTRMKFGDRVVVTARVGRGPGPVPTQGISGAAPRPSETVKVSPVMAVDLITDAPSALRVEALDPQHREQPILHVTGETFAEWMWQVKANEVGVWHLTLKVYVHLQGENVPVKEVTAPTVVEPLVEVSVEHAPLTEVGNFWASNWQYVGTTLVAAVVALAALLALGNRQAGSHAPKRTPRGPRQRRS